MHNNVTQGITAFHHFKFGGCNHPTLSGNDSDVTHIGQWVVLEAAIFFCNTNFRFNGFSFQCGIKASSMAPIGSLSVCGMKHSAVRRSREADGAISNLAT